MWAVALGAGAVAALGFPPFDLWPLTLFGIAVLIWLVGTAPTRRRAAARGWLFGVGHFTVGFDWIAHAFTYQAAMPQWLGAVAVVGLAMFLSMYPALAAAIAWRRGGAVAGRTLWLAAAWMLGEWLRGHLWTGFAWNPLGLALLPLSGVSQLARAIGALGLSGVVVLLAGALLWLASLAERPRWQRLAGMAAVLLALHLADFVLTPGPVPASPGAPVVNLIQPNIGKDDERDGAATVQAYLTLTRQALSAHGGVAIWPEGAVDALVAEDPAYRRALASYLPPGSLLLFGGHSANRAAGGTVVSATNSLFGLDSTGALVGRRYDKAHLVPGGEYMPFGWITGPLGLRRLVPGDIDFAPGPGATTIRYPGLPPVGPAICYEIIFGAAVADERDRPAWLLTISDDAWYGTSGPPQHWAQARLRAIEEGLPVVRSTPTGITGVIDARGTVLAEAPAHRVAVVSAPLPPPAPPTPFGRWGHGTSLVFGLLLAGLGVVADRLSSRSSRMWRVRAGNI